ncbi:MAG: DUF6456 domain-containing protein [Pseudomonadota bacterium]
MIVTERKCLRALAKGGMAIERQDGFAVYRSTDARRSVVGVVGREVFAELQDQGFVERRGERYHWTQKGVPDAVGPGPEPPPPDAVLKAKPRSLLQKAMSFCADEDEVLRLADAARRFLRDLAAAGRGPAVTMNWDLIPRGASRHTAGMSPGASLESSMAAKRLEVIEKVIGNRTLDLLMAVLCRGLSQRQLAVDFGCSVRTLPTTLHIRLTQLADAYDSHVSN